MSSSFLQGRKPVIILAFFPLVQLFKRIEKMNSKRKFSAIISIILSVLVVCGGILFVEAQTKLIRRWMDNVLYDNWKHYLPCSQLPPVSEVEKTVQEHWDVIQQIKAVNPGLVGIEINNYTCGGEQKADITFWYASHNDRVVIEQIIDNDTFFGVPYNLNNR